MAEGKKGYLDYGFGDTINLIFAIIPFTSGILGGITRILRGHIIAGILQLITPAALVFWIMDIISIVKEKDLTWYA